MSGRLGIPPHRAPAQAFVDQFAHELLRGALEREAEGRVGAATVLRRVARDLYAEFHRYNITELSYADASRESGYDADSLRKLVAQGRWSKRRADLPRRPQPSPDRRGARRRKAA